MLSIQTKYPHDWIDGIRIFPTTEPGTPFSFFNNIFWNKELDISSARGKWILRHECYHVRQRHTLDLLYMELLRSVCWFNPFFHLIRKEIKANHEFLADRYASAAEDRFEYAELLVWHAAGWISPAIAHSFFNTHLKRRITMLTKTSNAEPAVYSWAPGILPLLFLLLFCAFAICKNRIAPDPCQPQRSLRWSSTRATEVPTTAPTAWI